jgi:hypothetical protein
MDVVKVIKGLIAFTPEIDCDQTAMGLPPVTYKIFLIVFAVVSTHQSALGPRGGLWPVLLMSDP